MDLNIASWNIWAYGPRDFKGIAKLIRDNKIDIIGIQEAAIYFDGEFGGNFAKRIADELGFYFVFYDSVDKRPRQQHIQGNAIISKFPIKKSESFNLNPAGVSYNGSAETEQRILISSVISVGGKNISFLTTHLQYTNKFKTSDIRMAEVEKIVEVIKKLKSPVVFVADLNSALKNKETIELEKYLKRVGGNKPTWTVYPFEHGGWSVNELKYRLDNIFLSKDMKCKDFKIIDSRISDHLPIMVTISF